MLWEGGDPLQHSPSARPWVVRGGSSTPVRHRPIYSLTPHFQIPSAVYGLSITPKPICSVRDLMLFLAVKEFYKQVYIPSWVDGSVFGTWCLPVSFWQPGPLGPISISRYRSSGSSGPDVNHAQHLPLIVHLIQCTVYSPHSGALSAAHNWMNDIRRMNERTSIGQNSGEYLQLQIFSYHVTISLVSKNTTVALTRYIHWKLLLTIT